MADLYVVEESEFTEGGGVDTIAICRTRKDADAIVAETKASRGGFCERVGVYERDFDAPKSLIAEEGYTVVFPCTYEVGGCGHPACRRERAESALDRARCNKCMWGRPCDEHARRAWGVT